MSDLFTEPIATDPSTDVIKLLLTLAAYRQWQDTHLPEHIRTWFEREATDQEILALSAAALTRIAHLK